MTIPKDIATQLFEAHVAHQLDRLRGGQLVERIETEVAALFAWLAQVKLTDIVTPGQINMVIQRYVIELKISGAFTELSGEMSRLVVSSPINERTRVDEVMSPDSFSQFADKLSALDALWRELIHLVVQSDAFATLLLRVLQRAAIHVVGENPIPLEHPLVEGLITKLRPLFRERLEPFLSNHLEALIKRVARRSESGLAGALDSEATRALIDEVWEAIAATRLSDAFAYLSSHDLEDFVVLIYEFWQRYRKTPHFREVSSVLVNHFFDKYGDVSALALLDDLGITSDMVNQELQSFLGPLFGHALETGFLEQRIRDQLATFYRSDAVAAIVGIGK